MPEEKKGKRPTHALCMIAKGEQEKFQRVGSGWEREDGSFSLNLNKGVTISWRDMQDHALYLFKSEQQPQRE